jgi:prepilin-type N-terminal cleavage/methylation domain-containing protein
MGASRYYLKKKNYRTEMNKKGFSLIEVVLASGVFAVTIVAVLGLYAPLSQSVNEMSDMDDASRLMNAVNSELSILDYTTIAAYNGKTLYSTRGGDRIGEKGLLPGQVPQEEAYFKIRLDQINAASSESYAQFAVEIYWPEYLPDGTPVTEGQEKLIFQTVINR